jgi:hypothetical protein
VIRVLTLIKQPAAQAVCALADEQALMQNTFGLKSMVASHC